MDSINSSGHPLNAVIEIDGILFLRDPGINHPFGRVCCKTRKIVPTVCDGTCGDCKKAMTGFRQNELLRMKANDIIRSGGDATYEQTQLDIYRKNLEKRIAKWQEQKQEIIESMKRQTADKKLLEIRVRRRQEVVGKMLGSPTIPYTLQ